MISTATHALGRTVQGRTNADGGTVPQGGRCPPATHACYDPRQRLYVLNAMTIGMIMDTEQAKGIEVVRKDDGGVAIAWVEK